MTHWLVAWEKTTHLQRQIENYMPLHQSVSQNLWLQVYRWYFLACKPSFLEMLFLKIFEMSKSSSGTNEVRIVWHIWPIPIFCILLASNFSCVSSFTHEWAPLWLLRFVMKHICAATINFLTAQCWNQVSIKIKGTPSLHCEELATSYRSTPQAM